MYHIRAREYEEKKSWSKAIYYYKKALSVFPHPIVSLDLALLLAYEKNDLKNALIEAQKANVDLIKKPSYKKYVLARKLCNIGNIHDLSNRRELAEKYYRESLKIKNISMTWVYLGALIGDSNRKNANLEALKCFQRALKLCPTDEEILANIALVYFKEKKYRMAERYVTKSLEIDSQYEFTNYVYSQILLKTNRQQLAKEYYQKALKLGFNPNENHNNSLHRGAPPPTAGCAPR